MDTRGKITKFLLFYFLVLFPFGQLFRISFGKGITLQPIDLVSIVSLFLLIKKDFKNRFFQSLIIVAGFSYIFSLSLFKPKEVLVGLMYGLRLLGYFSFYINLKKLFEKGTWIDLITKCLLAIALVSTIFGWIQYIFLPDFRSFKALGWDDHWFRIIGTFFDPGFLGIILVLGFILSLGLLIKNKANKLILLSAIILGISVAFTYSRASYLALIMGSFVVTVLTKNLKIFFLITACFLVVAINLPRPASSGAQLERTFSINLRLLNYEEGLKIVRSAPLFGIGYNNLCVFRSKYLKTSSLDSHACSGMDSSIIFVLATVGVVGFIILSSFGIQIIKAIDLHNIMHKILIANLIAVGVHSQFVNSLFYPWIMGYLAILSAVTFSRKKSNL